MAICHRVFQPGKALSDPPTRKPGDLPGAFVATKVRTGCAGGGIMQAGIVFDRDFPKLNRLFVRLGPAPFWGGPNAPGKL